MYMYMNIKPHSPRRPLRPPAERLREGPRKRGGRSRVARTKASSGQGEPLV